MKRISGDSDTGLGDKPNGGDPNAMISDELAGENLGIEVRGQQDGQNVGFTNHIKVMFD